MTKAGSSGPGFLLTGLREPNLKKKGLRMNKAGLKKHEIYNKVTEFTEQELGAIADFIDFMRHKKQLEDKKIIKLEGILRGYDIDFSDLKKFREETWRHVDEESFNG